MGKLDIVRAWKDEEYRNSLSEETLAQLPEHPAGVIELQDAELLEVAGGAYTDNLAFTLGCCGSTLDGFCPGFSVGAGFPLTSWPCC